MASAQPLLTYICKHAVSHDGQMYQPGDEFRCTDEAAVDALRKAGALLLPNELERPEDVAALQARLQSENDALQTRIAELEATMSAKGRKGQQASASDGGDTAQA